MRRFTDIREGDELSSVPEQEVTREAIIAYAGASGDFNPMHVDEVANLAGGMGGVFAHGMYGTGILGRLATDYLGDAPLDFFSVRCTEIVRPGDVLRFSGAVSQRRVEDNRGVVVFELTATNLRGEVTHTGTASASLPLPRVFVSDDDDPLLALRAIG